MRSYGNVLFSFYCEDIFFKKGLLDLLDQVYDEEGSLFNKERNIRHISESNSFYAINIVVLSSKCIFEKLPKIDKTFIDDDIGVVVFCSENMMHIIKGVSGYENAFFFTYNLNLSEVKSVFKKIIFGGEKSREIFFKEITLDKLTNREWLISELFNNGKTQSQINDMTGLSIKTISSHLRSAMNKYHVKNTLEYRIKLSNINKMRFNKLNDNIIKHDCL